MRFARADDHVIVHVHGEVDGQTAPLLRERLRDLIENQGNLRVAVNLGDMTFIDSVGLSVLLDMHTAAAARGGTFLLESPAPRTTRVFQMVGLDRVLVIAP
jgi:anti-anti-sigma factor